MTVRIAMRSSRMLTTTRGTGTVLNWELPSMPIHPESEFQDTTVTTGSVVLTSPSAQLGTTGCPTVNSTSISEIKFATNHLA